MIRLGIAEDQALFRIGIVGFLNSFSRIKVVEEAENSQELLDKYNEVPWDQNILNENKLNHNYEFINEDDNDFEEEEDLGPYCICSTKNRSPCTVLPCITLAEESAKKGIFLE